MNPESKLAGEHLAAAGRKRDRTTRLASALTVGAVIVLVFVLVALLDYWLVLPVQVRWLAFSSLSALLVAAAARLMLLWRRPTSLKEAALDLETTKPGIGCEVSTAAEYLSGERQVTRAYEQELVDALEKKAAITLQRTCVPYARRLVAPAIAVAMVLMFLLAFVTAFPAARTALMRAAAPWSHKAFTEVEVKPGSVEIPIGRDLDLTNIFRGRIPAKAELHQLEEGRKEWSVTPLTQATNGTFVHTLKNIRTSFFYRVSGSDAVSEDFTVTAYVAPEVRELRVHLDHPEYTGLKPAEQASAEITVVRGSTATFSVTPNVALSKARLLFTNNTSLDLQRDAQQRWTGRLPVTQDTAYRIQVFDAQGRPGLDDQIHHITAIPDEPPKVEITEPGGDMRAAATDKISIHISASDDFGVAELRVVYHRLGEAEQEAVVRQLPGTNTDLKGEFELDLSTLKLREYELVVYHAQARDNNTLDGPGIGRSPVYFIEITDQEGGKKPGKPGEKVNLLAVQKQIIADTAALAKDAAPEQFAELAARQIDAVAFARMYQTALSQTGAPLSAQGEMNAAVTAMEKSGKALEKHQREGAIRPGEEALASLYRVMQLMPELQNLPIATAPPKDPSADGPSPALKVVLEAIKKQNKDEPNLEEIAKALEQIQKLGRQQADLNSATQGPRNPADIARAEAANPAEAAPAAEGRGDAQAGGKAQGKGNGKGKGGGGGDAGNGKKGQAGTGQKPGQEGDAGKSNEAAASPEDQELGKLAPREEQLSKEARAIAERLARLAGKGSRLGKGAGRRMAEASGKMSDAAQAMRKGNASGAGSAGEDGMEALGSAAAMLENVLKGKPGLGDVVTEEAPQQYESAIAEYFRRLSRAQ